MWVFFRLLLIASNIVALLSYQEGRSNLDWGAGVLIGIICSGALYLWLTGIRSNRDTDWSLPYSFNQPFFPMGRYPLRFWILASYSLILAGATVVLRDSIENNRHVGFGGSFLVAGLLMAAALKLWIARFLNTARETT
jgi:hypothetical protein